MTIVKRLRLLTAVLGGTAVTAAVGTTVFGDIRPGASSPAPATRIASASQTDEAAKTRFTGMPALSYRTSSGETVFAWQIKPELPAQAARPRDILVMVDTSASQVGSALDRARVILTTLTKDAGPDDRIDVWTVNIDHPSATRSLTNGFQPANHESITAAAGKLADAEYGSGAVDLPAGLTQALKQFEGRAGRQQVLLYLGDGESAASKTPFAETARVELGNRMADRDVSFFAVPLGIKVHPHNLHGLASLTGGAVVRLSEDLLSGKGRSDFQAKLKASFDVPVLKTDRVTFAPAGLEVYPSRLPPLRGDRPTLIVGKSKDAIAALAARVEGRINGAKATIDLNEKLPAPSADHYFVNSVFEQWRAAPAKDAPAILSADRALAMAAEQFRMFRDEFTVQGVWAISADRLDHAQKLFEAAAKIDPDAPEAKAGLKVLAKVRSGDLGADNVKIDLAKGKTLARLQEPAPAQPAPAAGAKPAPAQPPAAAIPANPAEQDAVARARAAQRVREDEFRVLVDDTLRRSRRLLQTDPDSAYEDLKRQRDAVQADDQLSDPVRRRLVQDLESAMREVQLKGAEIKRQLASQRERISQARQRLNEFDRQLTQDEQTRARIDAFRQLMHQARFELAQQEAQVMIQERISRGQNVPPETYAAYRIGQAATQWRELRELRRLREDRYLLTMMQVEKSFVPYPDEPPVHFPPAAVWRELTNGRIDRYGNNTLGPDAPASFKRLRSLLEGETDKRVNVKNLATLSLDALLAQLSQEFADYGVRFVFRSELFPPDVKPGETKIKTTNDLSGLPLGSFLDTVLRDIEMSWIARPEYIEIGPNNASYSLRYDEKVTQVFDVAELIVPIPQSVNPSTLYGNLALQSAQLAIFGQGLGLNTPFGAGGGFGGVGGFGGGFGGGGFGGFNAGGAGLGAGGLGAPGGGGGFQAGGGGGPQGGILNAGGGGGVTGVLGNLSGQFGIQGNVTQQAQYLVTLITSTVARNEWDIKAVGGFQNQVFNQQQLDEFQPAVENRVLNSIGFYPTAKALVIRGSHRYHPTNSFKLKRGDAMAAGGPGLPRNGQFAGNNPPKQGNAPVNAAQPKPPAGANVNQPLANADPNKDATDLVAKVGKDPAKIWNAALDRAITDPDLIVDAVEALFAINEPAHAAEILKASLRKGRTRGNWAHDALAIALQAGQAAPSEVERASLSGIDLDPLDPKAFLKAAKMESDLGHHEVALAFCQRAASLEPNMPTAYANALVYAERADGVASDVVHWASSNLLRRDWAADGIDYHTQTKDRVEKIAKKYSTTGRDQDAKKLQAALATEKTRDIVIELLWQGQADLDLVVQEPSGSKCSAIQKRTIGGGVLKSDILEQSDDNRSEIYTAGLGFAGKYTVTVKNPLGKPLGNRATLKVTKHQGTDQEAVEVHAVDLTSGKPVIIELDRGSRTELASVPTETTEAQLETTQATGTFFGGNGIGAGFSATGSDAPNTGLVSTKAVLPVVAPAYETKLAGISSGQPGIRVEAKLSADRSKMVMSANPVFSGPATDIPMPKLNLLPGGGE